MQCLRCVRCSSLALGSSLAALLLLAEDGVSAWVGTIRRLDDALGQEELVADGLDYVDLGCGTASSSPVLDSHNSLS